MKKSIVIFIWIISCVGVAQDYKFGKVSKEELEEVIYVRDSAADAAILYEKKKLYYLYSQGEGFKQVTEVQKRIKLYKKEGFGHATAQVYLFKDNSNREKILGLSGRTFELKKGKIIETKLKSDGIFKGEYSENYNQVKFTMPALNEGVVIEYKYKIVSPFTRGIDRIYLQDEIPIKKIDVEIKMPEYYNFKKNMTGYISFKVEESKEIDKITFNTKARSQNGTSYRQDQIDYTVSIDKIQMSNVPAFKKEPYAGNSKNYISSIDYELSFVQFPNSPIRTYSTTWVDVAKTVYRSSNFGDELKKQKYYKEELDKELKGVLDQSSKIIKVYEFVKKKVKWNDKNGVGTIDGVKKAFKEGVGNTAEINIMLMSMLRYVGIDVKPVLVSSIRKPISLFPTLDGFDYVIVRVKFPDGKIWYLDATDPYGQPNILPNRVIQGIGRVIAENGTSQLVDFRPKEPSKTMVNVKFDIQEDGTVKGVMNTRYMSYEAHRFRERNGEKENRSNSIKKRFELTEIKDYELKGIKEYGKGVNERFSFIIENVVEAVEDELFFSPLFFLKQKENIFKSEERKFPVDFSYSFSSVYRINIKIPEGYEVIEVPKASVVKLPDGLGMYSFKMDATNQYLQLVLNEVILEAVIPSDYYPTLREFYNSLVEKGSEQIVLKKK